MPSRVHDKDDDREPASTEARERRRYKQSRPRRKNSNRDGADDLAPERSSTPADPSTRRRTSITIPELQRPASSASPNGSRASLPYPTFSKAHSREAVGSKENVSTASKKDPYTPETTDLQPRRRSRDEREQPKAASVPVVNAPPSPPLTAVDQAAAVEEKREPGEKQSEDVRTKLGERRSGTKLGGSAKSSSTRGTPVASTSKTTDRSSISSIRRSKTGTPTKMKPKPGSIDGGSSVMNRSKARSLSPAPSSKVGGQSDTASTVASDNTSIAPQQHSLQTPFSPDAGAEASPAIASSPSPRSSTPRGTPFQGSRNPTPAYDVPTYGNSWGTSSEFSPMPPPPPPPPAMTFRTPRVDYLMYNGGLPHPIPKNFLAAPDPSKAVPTAPTDLPNPTRIAAQVERFFAPFNSLLEDYTKVMDKNGSIAVATGYRSIARRLLDRLEAVFARDISSEYCDCIMCQGMVDETAEIEQGISWGEILEYVCGRRELPPWPAFVLTEQAPAGLGISAATPMQKLDIDVPEEYREHYIRQSRKTKMAVDKWLAGQSEDAAGAPEDADDDTLTFAILTRLDPFQRPVFSTLLGVIPSRPPSIRPRSRAPTPLNAPKPELLERIGLAIQRLYRLANPPRAPESAVYLLNNPSLHNVLATLAAVSDGEWEILVSGRFDGFLRSGAEDLPSAVPSRNPTPAPGRVSRGPTPLPPNGTAPASAGGPVAMDEDTEIAVLAEVEREIYLGMEALEDAFEALHSRAEVVRRGLRERGAGLSMSAQARRGSLVEARMGTPANVLSGSRGWDSETDDGIDDGMSELAPDDSASNVSSSRHRRPKRRTERRTPALVEEEDELGAGEGGGADVMREMFARLSGKR